MVVFSCQLMGQELQELKQEKQQLQQKCEQQEQALQEMGLHLSQSVLKSLEFEFVHVSHYSLTFFYVAVIFNLRSKLKMEDFKEVNKALKVKTRNETRMFLYHLISYDDWSYPV